MKEDFRTCHCSRANKLAGVGALAAIIWLIISRSFVGKLIGLHMYVGLLYLLLTASCLAVLISFLGWFGASNRVKWMLYLFKCCGVKSYEDWNKNIPQSCCRIIKFQLDPQCNVTSFPPTAIYKDGCYALMVHFVSTHLVYICIFGLATGFLEVLCAALSFALATIILQAEYEVERDSYRDELRNKRKHVLNNPE
ncbi:uncharacterized protein [Hetaerina americana]|uniref:uncharacterized protein isoform X3 n=1 Tax=Hetaerina americana TaxID=62018 RepID=UPI003A7F4890